MPLRFDLIQLSEAFSEAGRTAVGVTGGGAAGGGAAGTGSGTLGLLMHILVFLQNCAVLFFVLLPKEPDNFYLPLPDSNLIY